MSENKRFKNVQINLTENLIEMWDRFNELMWETYKKRVGWK